MIAFVDSSVLIRKLFGEADQLTEWSQIREAYDSRVLLVEQRARRAIRSIEVLEMTDAILVRAAAPMPTVVGTLDAIHLATALELREFLDSPLVLATHDDQLARAALASGLDVIGQATATGG